MTRPQSLGIQKLVVTFRADASLEIGSGHVMRCLTLAEALRDQGAQCEFICGEHSGHVCEVIEARGFSVHRLPVSELSAETSLAGGTNDSNIEQPTEMLGHADWLGTSWERDAETCQSILATIDPTWLVVDHYALDHRWESVVLSGLSAGQHLMVIDDLADRSHVCELLLDQNVGRQTQDYNSLVPENCQVLAGPQYALLRPEFAHWRAASLARRTRMPQFNRLLISLGGVDKDNITGKILEALADCDLPNELEITVVMGATAPWRKEVAEVARQLPWPTEVVVNVNDMARRMTDADLAIGAAGSTTWERCCLGLPTLMVVLADNQRGIAHDLETQGASMTLDLTDLEASLMEKLALLKDPLALTAMIEKAAELVDGQGTDRILSNIKAASSEVVGD